MHARLGILLSPYSPKERGRFQDYAKAFGAFASGYLLSKADKDLETLLSPAFLLDNVHGFRTRHSLQR